MVTLSDPSPNPPISGQSVNITAVGGAAGYHFKWQIDEQGEHVVHQVDSLFKINVPTGNDGETLTVSVRDGDNETARRSWTIGTLMVGGQG